MKFERLIDVLHVGPAHEVAQAELHAPQLVPRPVVVDLDQQVVHLGVAHEKDEALLVHGVARVGGGMGVGMRPAANRHLRAKMGQKTPQTSVMSNIGCWNQQN